jgi:hypothetical protein
MLDHVPARLRVGLISRPSMKFADLALKGKLASFCQNWPTLWIL